jgi:hypothetical protein
MAQITGMFSENCTYYSVNLGFFIGREDVVAMQTQFHGQYESVTWTIDEIAEIKPNVVEIAFSFNGRLHDGSEQNRKGREHFLIVDGLIQHIAVGV